MEHVRASNKTSWCVTLPKIHGFVHIQALEDVARTVAFGLQALGYESYINSFVTKHEEQIVFGLDRIKQYDMPLPPSGAIVYNLEQYDWCLNLPNINSYVIWDYSEANVARLKSAGHPNVKHVPIGYVPQLTEIELESEPSIDVLFCGCMNPRRKIIIDGLKEHGLKIAVLEDVYGEARARFISKSKVVLNMHYADSPGIFEVVRVSYLLANRCCVISERGIGCEPFEEAAFFVDYKDLVETCVEAIKDRWSPDWAEIVGRNALKIMSGFDEREILRKALA